MDNNERPAEAAGVLKTEPSAQRWAHSEPLGHRETLTQTGSYPQLQMYNTHSLTSFTYLFSTIQKHTHTSCNSESKPSARA